MDATQIEVSRRTQAGARCLALEQFKAEYARLGYRFDRSCDCASQARYMSGPHAGASYPALSLYPVEADTGRSAWNVESRRDANFKALQALRGEVFAVSRGRIVEV